jgi:hypothetical protein
MEINRTNTTTAGSSFTRKKGIIIRSRSELEQFDQLLSNPKVVELAKKIEAVNPKYKEDDAANTSSNTEVLDI